MKEELLSSQLMWFWILRRLTTHSSSPATVNECEWDRNPKSSVGLRGSTGGSACSLKTPSTRGDITGRYAHIRTPNDITFQSPHYQCFNYANDPCRPIGLDSIIRKTSVVNVKSFMYL